MLTTAAISKHLPMALLAVTVFCIAFLYSPAFSETYNLSEGDLNLLVETEPDDYLVFFGPRFDRTAVIRSISRNGYSYLGRWGMPDEFGIKGNGTLGYNESPLGGGFIKIGLGVLERTRSTEYNFSEHYPVKSLFSSRTKVTKNSLVVEQNIDNFGPWSYFYRKSYRLVSPEKLVITYELKNTGSAEWSFEHYNHHWFSFSNEPVSEKYSLQTSFVFNTSVANFLALGRLVKPRKALNQNETLYLAGLPDDFNKDANGFILYFDEQPLVEFRGDFKVSRFSTFADQFNFCPEIFFGVLLKPGDAVTWSATYLFPPRTSEMPPDSSSRVR